jgi:hypothetical protein
VWIPRTAPALLDIQQWAGSNMLLDYLSEQPTDPDDLMLITTGEKLIVNLTSDPDYYVAQDEQWFCIAVNNNWSWEKARIITPQPQVIPVPVTPPKPLPDDLCCEEVPPKPPFVPKPIPPLCTPCTETTSPEEEQLARFLQWYNDNVNNNIDFTNTDLELDYVKVFIDNFKGTDIYQRLLTQSTPTQPLTTAELETIKLQERLAAQIDGRNVTDLDYIVLIGKDEENQKLPLTFVAFDGALLELQLGG